MRIVVSLLGFSAICLGLQPLLSGGLFYPNWFDGLVFAPTAVLFGGLMILAAIFKPEYLDARPFERKRQSQRRSDHR